MAKTYTEFEAWGIFIGALVIGVVLTSIFWAYITIPEDVRIIEQEIKNASVDIQIEKPDEFIIFCKKVGGISAWDSKGFKECVVEDSSEKNLVVMNLLCKKFNLTLSYGSFGVKCDNKY